jgi:hypothetical protein
MKSKYFILTLLLMMSGIASAQIGIGTSTPESTSILELKSNAKGFLMPRMTINERNLIVLPATGLIVYNTETAAFNFFDGSIWKDVSPASSGTNSISYSVDATGDVTTMSKTDELISGMTITPGAGKYTVAFNGQYNSAPFTYDVNITQQSLLDLLEMYKNLMAIPTTDSSHGAIFGNGEILTAGVYSFPAASSLAGDLFLNAAGNPNAVFIFKLGAAFTSGAGSKVILANAASSCNVFWVAEGEMALAATTSMKGTLLGHNGAVSMAAGSTLEGRMFSTIGAVTIDGSTVKIPSNCSYLDIGVLSSFALYTAVGAVTNTGISTVTGDIGSNLGLISGFDFPPAVNNAVVIGNIYGPTSELVTIDKNVVSTFSIYQNGVLVPNSNRTRRSKTPTTDITLQAIATVLDGQAIEVRWKTDVSQLKMTNRIITVVKTQ